MWFPTLLQVVLAAQAQLVLSKPSKPTVFFIRHGEKPASGDGLSTDGLQRAQCLRNVFAKNSSFHIDLIIAQRPQPGNLLLLASTRSKLLTTPDGSRKRPYDTVLPLSRDLGLKVDTHCERDDVACVGETVRGYTGRGNILVCWEHRTMSNITYLLGDMNPPLYPTSE